MRSYSRRAFGRDALLLGAGAFGIATLAADAFFELHTHERDLVGNPPRPPTAPPLLLLGSSRTAAIISPERTRFPVCNYGRAWSTPAMMLVRFERVLALFRPAAVLIEFVPALFGQSTMDSVPPGSLSAREAIQYTRYVDSPAAWYKQWVHSRIVPFDTYKREFQIKLRDRTGDWSPVNPKDDNWAGGAVTPERRARGLEFAAFQYTAVLRDWNVQPGWDRAARDLLSRVTGCGIPLALYTMPESPEFRRWYAGDTADRARRYIERLGSDAGVPAWLCTDWVSEENDFIDGHHLTPSGAAQFSRRFWEERIAPWLQSVPLSA